MVIFFPGAKSSDSLTAKVCSLTFPSRMIRVAVGMRFTSRSTTRERTLSSGPSSLPSLVRV